MIGLDTNVLLRYALQDDTAQSARASDFVEALTPAAPGFINLVALAEAAWVLKRRYRFSNLDVLRLLEVLLGVRVFAFQSQQAIFEALVLAEARGIEFPDALTATLNGSVGCTHTMTFDKKAARRAGMTLLS